MKLIKILTLMAILAARLKAQTSTFSVLHEFDPIPGLSLRAPLTLAPDGTLYGAGNGPGDPSGTIFKLTTNGTLTILYSFSSSGLGSSGFGYTNSDGIGPTNGLILSGNTLYGTATEGGTNGCGTIFKVNTDGTGFATLHDFSLPSANSNFADTNGDGMEPLSALCLSGNTLYGTAKYGGTNGWGTIFAVNTDGTGFTTLHSFGTATNAYGTDPFYGTDIYTNKDGIWPVTGMVLSSGTLYGTTYGGGTNGEGAVFKVNADGTGFSLLQSLGSHGAYPLGGLALSGSTLYGTTYTGGTHGLGVIFEISTTGTGFNAFYNFGSLPGGYTSHGIFTNGDGQFSVAGLALSGSTLYGATIAAGTNGNGTIFKVSTSGTGFTTLYNNGNPPGSGASGPTGVTLFGNTLYATRGYGGNGSSGDVFKINTDGTGFFDLANANDGAAPIGGLVLSGCVLYGTASEGGANGYGTNYGTVFKINTDGSNYTNLYIFTNGSDGATPVSSLSLYANILYGTAEYGGTNGSGTIFAVNTNGGNFTSLHAFSQLIYDINTGYSANSDGANPAANMVRCGNILYGATKSGGGFGNGTLFKINLDGSGFTNFYTFTGLDNNGNNLDGAHPQGGLILSDNTLYGTAFGGGTNGFGTVFAIGTNGADFTTVHNFTTTDFNNANPDGALPAAGLIWGNGMLYGTTEYGGTNGAGTIFRVNADGSDFATLHHFDSSSVGDGANAYAGMILSGGTLYGTTDSGGQAGYGTVFAINTDGTGFTLLHNFSLVNDGSSPQAGLALSGNTLYGTASGGGSSAGTAFALSLGPIPLNNQLSSTNMNFSWGNPGFSLQSAPDVTGPWSDVPGASSPYTVPLTSPQQFFRLVNTNGQ